MMEAVNPAAIVRPTESTKPMMKVGFYGCNDGLVRLSYEEPRRNYPKHLVIPCPRCSKTHEVEIMWRKRVAADEGKDSLCLG